MSVILAGGPCAGRQVNPSPGAVVLHMSHATADSQIEWHAYDAASGTYIGFEMVNAEP